MCEITKKCGKCLEERDLKYFLKCKECKEDKNPICTYCFKYEGKVTGVYKITSPTGKVYIGESGDIYSRWILYYRISCKNQIKLYNSLKKHGADSHTFEIIEECPQEIRRCRERYWQEFYDVLNPEKGLNCKLTECGDSKQIFSKESVHKMKVTISTLSKSIPKGEQHWNYGNKGEKSILYGIPKTQEHIDKIVLTKSLREKTCPKSAKKVINVRTLQVYNCLSEVADFNHKVYKKLHNYLSGKVVNYSDFMYLKEYEKYGDTTSSEKTIGAPTKVICVKTLNVYTSIKMCANSIGISEDKLRRMLREENKNITNIIYLVDYDQNKEYTIKADIIDNTIIDTITKTTFRTLSEASKFIMLGSDELSRMISGKKDNKTSMVYLRDYKEGMVLEPQRIRRPTKVLNLLTGELYENIKEAALKNDIKYEKLTREFKKNETYNNLKIII